MFFRLLRTGIPPDVSDCAYLIADGWDDWFEFRTMFSLIVVDGTGQRHQVGSVKIANAGLLPGRDIAPGQRAPGLPDEFDQLGEDYFSLGQGEDYYQNLNTLSQDIRKRVLVGLRDCAYDTAIFDAARNERSMQVSLLRSVPEESVRGRLHRLTQGDAELTEFRFEYKLQQDYAAVEPPRMRFDVSPETVPPTNVHVLIGRNGVGKTRAMRHLVEALLGRPPASEAHAGASVELMAGKSGAWNFAGPSASDRIPSEQVGLRRRISIDGVEQGGIKAPADLAVDFRKSLEKCRSGLRSQRWQSAVETLESDDLFAEADVRALLNLPEVDWAEAVERHFARLSSGHAIVLLTITRLVELVDETTLVLLDEPEGHLHPPCCPPSSAHFRTS